MEKKTSIQSCAGDGCHAGCMHMVHVEDGRVTNVEGLTFPDGEQDFICMKARAGSRWLNHPDRLRHPLKRVGKRGEGKWEQITWEQALDEIATSIMNIRDHYGPESIFSVPPNSPSPAGGIQNSLLPMRFFNLLQATVFSGAGVDSNPVFASRYVLGQSFIHCANPRVLVENNTRYMINWGANPAETSLHCWRYIREAQKGGMKLVDIGLIHDRTAKASDWWIPVQAGSDGALALSMIHVLIRDSLFDETYISRYTNVPFLVRTDNGLLLRENEITSGGSPFNYVIWDATENRAQVIPPQSEMPGEIKPALLGKYQVAGIECKPVFQMLADLARKYIPERAQMITGVSAENIERLAREFVEAKPAAVLVSWGLRYLNSGNAYRAIYTLAALTGNIGMPGGGVICGGVSAGPMNSPELMLNDFPVVLATESFARSAPAKQIFDGMITGKPHPVKAMLLCNSNWVQSYPNRRRWIEEALPNLDLVVVSDIFMTASAEYADYVLPDCTLYEREDITVSHGGYIVYLEKAREPMHDCRPGIYLWSELARRLGFGEHFQKSIDEWIELRLNSNHPSVAEIQPPLTLERLKKEKVVRANVPRQSLQPLVDKKFPTPSGRIELYNEEFVAAGDTLPVFREQLESPRSDLAKRYPLVFNTASNIFFVHTAFANDPLIQKSYLSEPHLSINPADARSRKISDGDIVTAYNDRGSCKLKAIITEAVPPGVVHVPHGWWPKQFIEGHLQDLIPSVASAETADRTREIHWHISEGKFDYFGLPEQLFSYSPDAIFDCLCEVKRTEEEGK